MHDYQSLETPVLVDMLANHTAEYTKMLTDNMKGEAFDACELTISLLQSEINSRAQTTANTNISDADIKFTTAEDNEVSS